MNREDVYKLLKEYRKDLNNTVELEDLEERRSKLEKISQQLGLLLINIPIKEITPILFNTIELFYNDILKRIWDTK
ncbi:MAG: hypothetical protein ISR98_00130 [Parcubacteria group bacterium]|nr:hypothetical protein [Parcubacteria group bacterium]